MQQLVFPAFICALVKYFLLIKIEEEDAESAVCRISIAIMLRRVSGPSIIIIILSFLGEERWIEKRGTIAHRLR